ncbi:MAG TPA: DUF58 domain-containing protein [Acidimicrobiia bacterium]|nr:DUF58 domain-containing protein [Acidimicrobiia bacterium]
MTVTAFGRHRTRDRPGPGPVPEAVLRALEIKVARKIEGLLPGEQKSNSQGFGSELTAVRPYQPGDDVRRIEWKVTARTNQPHVRVDIAEKSLMTWLALDTSPSMGFGTGERRKWDVAEGVALAMGHLASRRGGRLAVMTYGSPESLTIPARSGRSGVRSVLAATHGMPRLEAAGPTSLGAALLRLAPIARQRGLVVVVGDFRGQGAWQQPMAALAHKHQVVAIEISDPRETALPDVGEIVLVDPETGRQLRVDTGSGELRRRFVDAAAAERQEVAVALHSIGVPHLVLSTAGDWLRALVTFLRRERRGW